MQRTHRPTSHKKDPMKQYQGAVSRAQGKHFEEYIDLSLRYYEQRGEAVVEKTPEPMRPTKDLGNGKFIAYYEKAAQPDYKGTLKGGRAVVFEAKYTHSAQMEQSRVTREQAARLDDHLAAGAMCFVVAVIASCGGGWEHVSVSLARRCPTWEEMCMVKDIFWGEEECVVQFHPPRSEYVNRHPYCLHLWKKIGEEYETPPKEYVG